MATNSAPHNLHGNPGGMAIDTSRGIAAAPSHGTSSGPPSEAAASQSTDTTSVPGGSQQAGGNAEPGCYAPLYYSAALADFQRRFGAYASTAALDALRVSEYSRLDRLGHVYLDYTGGGLYAESQLRAHLELLAGSVFGNPHSHNPTSQAMTELVEQARAAVLDFFGAAPAEYTVIFTPNASGALKLVGEAYPFTSCSRYLVAYDNHNSVNGIREFARARGARVTYVPTVAPELRLDAGTIAAELRTCNPEAANLFAYPAQSNFSGVQHPLAWIGEAQAQGWDVLLDCAAFAPTNCLRLDEIKPDFVPLSFYKMFGYPTGVGALIARRTALAKLRRPWFAGGTITIASVQGEGWHYLIPGEAGFEDGTVNYLSLPAVETGLRHLQDVGMAAIHTRVLCLTGWLLEQMASLRHANGASLVRIFGPRATDSRGATIAFTLLDPQGMTFDVRRVEALAGQQRISLRTGCFCNPGDGEVAHELAREDMASCFGGGTPVSFSEFSSRIHDRTGRTPSTIRVSLGIVSNFADVYRFLDFVTTFCNREAEEIEAFDIQDRPHAPDAS
jgi:selenocysteine lyase/cysteine desulfurase